MQAHLILPDGRRVPVTKELILGRVGGCDIVIDDTKASRRHARVLVESGVHEIEDLGSSNGTLLNGKPVHRRVLRDGDRVQIGQTEIVFRDAVDAGASAVTAPAAAVDAAPAASAPAVAADDEVDLFGDDDAAPVPTPPPLPRAAPPQAGGPTFGAPPSPPASAAPSRIVEFADEVVEVRTQKAKPAAAAPAARAGAAGTEPEVRSASRVLQYGKHAAPRGALGDDLAQSSGAYRLLVYALVLAGAVAVFWLVVQFVR